MNFIEIRSARIADFLDEEFGPSFGLKIARTEEIFQIIKYALLIGIFDGGRIFVCFRETDRDVSEQTFVMKNRTKGC